MDAEHPDFAIADDAAAEGEGLERAAEAVHRVALRAINDLPVDREDVALQLDLVARDGDYLLQDRARAARAGSGRQVSAGASESCDRVLKADDDQVVPRESRRVDASSTRPIGAEASS